MTDNDGTIWLLIELRVDPKRFDLTRYVEDAVNEGWARDPENGVDYLAQEICDETEAWLGRGGALKVVS